VGASERAPERGPDASIPEGKAPPPAAPRDARTHRDQQREERRERKRREQLQERHRKVEDAVAVTERRLRAIGEEIGRAGEQSAVERVHDLVNEYQRVERKLADLWAEWEELGTALEGAGAQDQAGAADSG
ncbi:MAG: hypothetical protein ABIL09_25630, partial [Gemmatimonadota bacterium]